MFMIFFRGLDGHGHIFTVLIFFSTSYFIYDYIQIFKILADLMVKLSLSLKKQHETL